MMEIIQEFVFSLDGEWLGFVIAMCAFFITGVCMGRVGRVKSGYKRKYPELKPRNVPRKSVINHVDKWDDVERL